MEKWLILRLGWEKYYKISLEHLVVPEREGEITHSESGGGMLKKNRNLLKELPVTQAGTICATK